MNSLTDTLDCPIRSRFLLNSREYIVYLSPKQVSNQLRLQRPDRLTDEGQADEQSMGWISRGIRFRLQWVLTEEDRLFKSC